MTALIRACMTNHTQVSSGEAQEDTRKFAAWGTVMPSDQEIKRTFPFASVGYTEARAGTMLFLTDKPPTGVGETVVTHTLFIGIDRTERD